MATLADIANQVNNTLSQINTNTQDTATTAGQIKGDTADIKLRLDDIKATIQSGVVVLAGGLFAIHQAQKQANALLEANVQQNETMICWMKTQADLLCRILHRMNTQIEIQTATRDAVVKLEKVMELVHARETLEVNRAEELRSEIERCCPPKQPEPEACFKGCPEPDIQRYDPKGQDWTPPGGRDTPTPPKAVG
jgi:hypothetical protein